MIYVYINIYNIQCIHRHIQAKISYSVEAGAFFVPPMGAEARRVAISGNIPVDVVS